MNVYAVVSETLHEISYDPPDEEWGALAVIVAARRRGQARYLAAKSDRVIRRYRPTDWPALWVKRLGTAEVPAGVIEGPAADVWWEKASGWEPGRRR